MLNRFSKDIETIDTGLAGSLQQVYGSMATFFSSLLIVSIVFPGFLIPATIIGFIYIRLGIRYLNTGRDLRRMESNSRSPIFSGFAELLDGRLCNHALVNTDNPRNRDCSSVLCRTQILKLAICEDRSDDSGETFVIDIVKFLKPVKLVPDVVYVCIVVLE